MSYAEFLAGKSFTAPATGFEPVGLPLNRPLFDFQEAIVKWSIRRGRICSFIRILAAVFVALHLFQFRA